MAFIKCQYTNDYLLTKKQLTGAEESGKLIWLSQRNDSFEETT